MTAAPGAAVPASTLDDRRFELIAESERRERANAPRYLLVLATGALAVAVVALLTQLAAQATAEARAAAYAATAANLDSAVQEYRAAQSSRQEAGATERLRPDPQVGSTLEEKAREAGVENARVTTTADTRRPSPGLRRWQYRFDLQGVRAESLFAWIARATTEIPGLEVLSFDLTPGTPAQTGEPGWNARIAFTRWERAE